MAQHDFEKSKPYHSDMGCPAGYHKRKGYTTSAGTYVPPRCVKAATTHSESSIEFRKREERKRTRRIRLHIPSIKSLTRKNCPPGMIPRKAYVRKYTTAVRKQGFTVKRSSGKVYRVYPKSKDMMVESRCVKDLGLPGKGPTNGKGIGPLHKGELARYGYSYAASEAQRHAALKAAVEKYGQVGVYRKLDAAAKLMMRTVPKAAAVFRVDREYVRRNFGPMKAV
jgi:hypothetical protein